MDKQSADRIIVKSNVRMKIVLDWFSKNREWMKQQEFHAPLDAGVVELQEEGILTEQRRRQLSAACIQ